MGTHKMIVSSPPVQVGHELWGGLRGGPGATRQSCHAMTDSEIQTLDKSGIQLPREAPPLHGDHEIFLCPKPRHVCDPQQLAPPIAFLHLALDQARRHMPLAHFRPSTTYREPLSKMGREGIKVHMQAITREEWEAAWGQELPQRVNDHVRCVLRAGTEMENGKNLRGGVDGQPQHVFVAAPPGAQFV